MISFTSPFLIILFIAGAAALQPRLDRQRLIRNSTNYTPGIHLIQLPEIRRQFLLVVPHELAHSPAGVPLVMAFHGFSDSPWYTNRALDLSAWLDRYGWLGILPFGLDESESNGLDGILACCPSGCDEECCKNGRHLRQKDHTACRWRYSRDDIEFTKSLVRWAEENTLADTTKVFATGFSNGGMFVNHLYCSASELFRVFAPISGDSDVLGCHPARPASYISVCGSKDDEARCQYGFKSTTAHLSHLMSCRDDGLEEQMSATTKCKTWHQCTDGNFVEWCETTGLGHDPSGHLRPDDTSYLRPASDLDITEYIMQKFSLFADKSILFYDQPTDSQLRFKQENGWPPASHDDHLYLRQGRLLGHDKIE